jgi:hypothetical protein
MTETIETTEAIAMTETTEAIATTETIETTEAIATTETIETTEAIASTETIATTETTETTVRTEIKGTKGATPSSQILKNTDLISMASWRLRAWLRFSPKAMHSSGLPTTIT